jgi:hypothetical protein
VSAAEEKDAFAAVLGELMDRQRDEVLAAYAALEHGLHPVEESRMLALRDPALRARVNDLLRRTGRTLIELPRARWASGYRDEISAALTADGWSPLPEFDRAVLVLVLVHSIAIPRSRGTLTADGWSGGEPTPVARLTEQSRLQPRSEITAALTRLHAAGLVTRVTLRAGTGASAAYRPGPALDRLTPAARRRLEENLVLAAAPASPLATAIRTRRTLENPA